MLFVIMEEATRGFCVNSLYGEEDEFTQNPSEAMQLTEVVADSVIERLEAIFLGRTFAKVSIHQLENGEF